MQLNTIYNTTNFMSIYAKSLVKELQSIKKSTELIIGVAATEYNTLNNDVIKEYSQQMELGDSWDSIAFQADSIISHMKIVKEELNTITALQALWKNFFIRN